MTASFTRNSIILLMVSMMLLSYSFFQWTRPNWALTETQGRILAMESTLPPPMIRITVLFTPTTVLRPHVLTQVIEQDHVQYVHPGDPIMITYVTHNPPQALIGSLSRTIIFTALCGIILVLGSSLLGIVGLMGTIRRLHALVHVDTWRVFNWRFVMMLLVLMSTSMLIGWWLWGIQSQLQYLE